MLQILLPVSARGIDGAAPGRKAIVKISLHLGQNDSYTSDGDREKAMEREVAACRKGDWEAKARLVNTFMPLLTNLARKRSTGIADINRYIEAGKEGLLAAARHHKDSSHTKFQIFALRYIEEAMNKADRRGIFSRFLDMFGR